ncbi:unnamed protein product [Symbiodinium sp. CCMP2592]|nr:unnamed protein product [Symbiodinium sp. CCMP2592]
MAFDLTEEDEENGEESETWYVDEVRRLEEVDRVGVECSADECELPSTSCLWFRLDQDDDEDEGDYCRAVRNRSTSSAHENQPVEVILDSGADCTVLPAELYGSVGSPSLEGNMSVLLDAQGNRIAGGEERVQVCFQIRDEDGTIIEFNDRVVLAHVQQPLFCLGKLMKRQWKPECDEFGRWTMRRGEACFPLHWSRNSLATYMTISRVYYQNPEDPHQHEGPSPPEASRVQIVVEIPEELELHARDPGWSMDANGHLVHLGLNTDKTCDASLRFNPDDWPHRSTLLWREGRKYEIFECGECWSERREIDLGEKSKKVITVLSKGPLDPDLLGTPVSGGRPRQVAPRAEGDDNEDEMEVDRGDAAQPRPEGPMLGPHAVEVEDPEQEAVVVNDVRLTETSPLRELRIGCRFLNISKNGSKAAVWKRLKREVALAKLKVSVEASEAVKAEYDREPLVPALAERPSEELVLLHETTHLPRADWCEACLAARSREDNYDDSGPTREFPVISIDYMFTGTEGEEQPLATHLVVVDSQSKYTQAIAIDGKGGRSLKHCVEEIVRMASALGYPRIGLRYDTEPAMKQLASYVVATRLKMGLATEEEPIPPEAGSHGASRAERFIGTIRSLGNCLLKTIEQHTGHKTESKDPLFSWAFRHAAFLHTRFKVQKDGCSPFELVHGRKYKSKLVPFGSFVYAQFLPKSKSKGETWKPCIWLGRSTLGDLNIVGDSQGIHQARSVRLSPKRYDVEALKIMKGVPWDHTLEVLPMRRRKTPLAVRLPVIAEGPELPPGPPAPPGDEAASDPPSPDGAGGAGISSVGSAPSVSSMSLPGESSSAMSSGESAELMVDVPGGVNRLELEEEMPTGHDGEEGFAEADGDPLEAGLEVDWRVDESAEPKDQVDHELSKEWASRRYEDGPPQLPAEKLQILDAAMDKVELNRLLEMGVLKQLTDNDDTSGMMNLQSKFVRDWRFRSNAAGTAWSWVRRSRLVAKEFRFIDPTMEHLYAPASLACLQKLFASLACSCPKLRLYTGDIKDAYLTVPQRRPTFIRLDGFIFELLFNLPGQRAGARDFYDKLAGVMTGDGLEAFEAAPALFIQPKKIGVSTHVDDLEILSTDERVDQLKAKLKGAGLSFSIEGPCTFEGGECHFLKRKFTGTGEGILVSQDGKHIEKLVELLGLQRAAGKSPPSPLNPHDVKDDTPLDERRHGIYRTAVGVLLYLGQDRPECLYAIKLLSGKCTAPTEHEWGLLRHLVKFLKSYPEQGILLTPCNPGRTLQQRCLGLDAKHGSEDCVFGEGHLLEAVSDASWAGERDRRSISAMTIYLNGNLVHATNRRQKSITLSSCEAELHGSLAAVQEGIFLRRVLERLCGSDVELRHRVDSSSCRAVINKQGLSRMRHVEIAFLWIQDKCRAGEFTTSPIGTKFCPPDLMTKAMNQQRIRLLSFMLGISRNGELVGKAEFEEEVTKHELKRVKVSDSAYAIRGLRKLLFSLLVAESASCRVTCSDLEMLIPSMRGGRPFLPFVIMVLLLLVLLSLFYGVAGSTTLQENPMTTTTTTSMTKVVAATTPRAKENPRSSDASPLSPKSLQHPRNFSLPYSEDNTKKSTETDRLQRSATAAGPPIRSLTMSAEFMLSWSEGELFKGLLLIVMLAGFFGAILQMSISSWLRIIGRIFKRNELNIKSNIRYVIMEIVIVMYANLDYNIADAINLKMHINLEYNVVEAIILNYNIVDTINLEMHIKLDCSIVDIIILEMLFNLDLEMEDRYMQYFVMLLGGHWW